jgi:hypothetical protein
MRMEVCWLKQRGQDYDLRVFPDAYQDPVFFPGVCNLDLTKRTSQP